jgi:molybdopterin-guanine dinucleotide biosynthesis protein B
LKAVGIVGYHNSGKTTLIRALARELRDRGHRVVVVKHSVHHLDLQGKDTATLAESADQVAFISPSESMILWKQPKKLDDLLPQLDADIALIEGFKSERTFPKIVCLRGEPDDKDLFDGLAVCAVGPAGAVPEAGIPFLDRDSVGEIAGLVEERAFWLPNLNCGGCGHDTCYGLALEIVAGHQTAEDCVSLEPATQVTIDGRPLAMNPFISRLVRGAILGVLSPLKGFFQGKIEIRIE